MLFCKMNRGTNGAQTPGYKDGEPRIYIVMHRMLFHGENAFAGTPLLEALVRRISQRGSAKGQPTGH